MSDSTSNLLASYKVVPRPTYYNAVSGEDVSISVEFEEYLITLDNQTKQSLISRLRKSINSCVSGLDRDGLEMQAADFEARATGAVAAQLSQEVGDYSSFSTTALQDAADMPETKEIIESVGYALGTKVFQSDQAAYDIGYVTQTYAALNTGTDNDKRKKQLRSWIAVLTQYIT